MNADTEKNLLAAISELALLVKGSPSTPLEIVQQAKKDLEKINPYPESGRCAKRLTNLEVQVHCILGSAERDINTMGGCYAKR